jgi:hypothetical protein
MVLVNHKNIHRTSQNGPLRKIQMMTSSDKKKIKKTIFFFFFFF